jgi:cephalosporin hydroxylase
MNYQGRMKELARSLIARIDIVSKEPSINEHCAEFEANNWVISDFVLANLYPIVGVRPFPLSELMIMSAAVCRLRPTHIFEWGTHVGKSARVFYETSRCFKIKCDIHSVDLPDNTAHIEHPGRRRGELVKDLDRIFLHQGDGLETALSIYNSLGGKRRVLFFLDGDHSYESVKREIDGIISTVNGAWIIVHDTFYQSEESGYNIGPYRAIEDSLQRSQIKYKQIMQNMGLPGMVLLYRNTNV